MAAVVVRVKRKVDQDPADTLEILAKKSRTGSTDGEDNNASLKTSFRFAGTVADKDCPVDEPIKQAIRKEKIEKDYKLHQPQSVSVESRRLKKVASSKARFAVVASNRKLGEEAGEGDDEVDGQAASSAGGDAKKDSDNKIERKEGESLVEAAEKLKNSGLDVVKLFDIEQLVDTRDPLEVLLGAGTKKEETVTCNGVPMLRESIGAAADADANYVYDVYFARDLKQCFKDVDHLLSVDAYQEDYMFSEYRDNSDGEVHDDDDDSNDEDNWRNDYPDEEAALFPDLLPQGGTAESRWQGMMAELHGLDCGGDVSSDDDDGDVYGSDVPRGLKSYAAYRAHAIAQAEALTDDDDDGDYDPEMEAEGISGCL